MRGFDSAKDYHVNNTGLPYKVFKLEKDGQFSIVRVLQSPSEWVSIFFHNKFNVLKRTRCLAVDGPKDGAVCPLCAAGAPRSLKTFIPVRVRADDQDRAQFIEYGRDALQEVIAQLDELKDNGEEPDAIMNRDYKVKRMGTKTDTSYKWMVVAKSEKPLTAAEKKIEILDLEKEIPLPDAKLMEERVAEWNKNAQVEEATESDEPKAKDSRF